MQNFFGAVLIIILAFPGASVGQAQSITQFQANLAAGNLNSNPPSSATGTATFTLTEPTDGSPTLDYSIQFSGLDLNATGILPNGHDPVISNQTTDQMDDVWGIHIHHAPSGSVGPHVLNVIGRPANDDGDIVPDFGNNSLTGLWDDTDTFGTSPPDSKPLTNFLQELHHEELFLIIHSWGRDNGSGLGGGATIGGRIELVPEPATMSLVFLAMLCVLYRFRRR